jgi:hypothetical protein
MAENKKKQEEKRQDLLHPHNGNKGGNRFSSKESQGGRPNAGDGDQDGSGNKRTGSHKAGMRARENDKDQARNEGRSGSDINDN